MSFGSMVKGLLGGLKGGITVEELRAMIARQEDMTIVDVRTPGEFTPEHIAGSVNCPLAAMETNPVSYLGIMRHNNKIVLCCASGPRSIAARNLLISKGKREEDVFWLKGGMKAWQKKGGVMISD